jgi:hypothetical protein
VRTCRTALSCHRAPPAQSRRPGPPLAPDLSGNDEAIPPDAQLMFAKRMGAETVEVPSSHLAMVSRANEVVKLIEAAAAVIALWEDGQVPMIDVCGYMCLVGSAAAEPRRDFEPS